MDFSESNTGISIVDVVKLSQSMELNSYIRHLFFQMWHKIFLISKILSLHTEISEIRHFTNSSIWEIFSSMRHEQYLSTRRIGELFSSTRRIPPSSRTCDFPALFCHVINSSLFVQYAHRRRRVIDNQSFVTLLGDSVFCNRFTERHPLTISRLPSVILRGWRGITGSRDRPF